MRALLSGLAMVALLGLPGPALSEPSSKPRKGDPNEVVCEKIEVIGSRLAVKRVCGTRAEWAEKRKADRDILDQVQRAANGPCNTVNTHTGAPAC
jgi:hypothetical protein